MWKIFSHIAWITISVTVSSFVAGIEGILLYFYFFEGFQYTFTGLVIADIMLMIAGIIAFVFSCRAWYNYYMMIQRVKKRVQDNNRKF